MSDTDCRDWLARVLFGPERRAPAAWAMRIIGQCRECSEAIVRGMAKNYVDGCVSWAPGEVAVEVRPFAQGDDASIEVRGPCRARGGCAAAIEYGRRAELTRLGPLFGRP